MVKTDGEFLFVANQDGITIIRAYPPEEMGVVSRISKDELARNSSQYLWVSGMFLLESRLVVISGAWGGGEVVALSDVELKEVEFRKPPEPRTTLAIFDVSDTVNPTLLHSYQVSGDLRASRMTSGYVYVLTQSYISRGDDGYSLPEICMDSRCEDFNLDRVFYDPEAEGAGSFTNVLAIDPIDDEYGYMSVIAGYASTVYMSHENLYVAFSKFGGDVIALSPLERTSRDGPVTSIYKIGVEGLRLWVDASGDVEGWLLNQFSLDEHDSYLRVVTSDGWMDSNDVYVLDEDLKLVGALQGLAPGEQVYSARFVGEALYLVTFKKVDPFFVIDLSNPTAPEVLGFLKIPGFSQYLHPWDENLILGVGKDTVEAEQGDFAWFQGLKLSLFDVTDVGNPEEVAKLIIGDRGTHSPVLDDHKAFLGIKSRDLIVLPLDLVEVDGSDNPELPPFVTEKYHWQGAYVISVSPDSGFELFGTVSHIDASEDPTEYGLWYSGYQIHRSLYIGDYLYTISESMVKANSLIDLSPVGHVHLGQEA